MCRPRNHNSHIITCWLILCCSQVCRYICPGEGFGVHYNYDDEAQVSPTICHVSKQFDYKLSTVAQLKRESERGTLQRWWWSTNTSCHLSCFHVFDHFNYMLSAGEREREREKERERECRRDRAHARESASDTCYTEWVRGDTWWGDRVEERKRGQSCMWEKAGSGWGGVGGYIESESG